MKGLIALVILTSASACGSSPPPDSRPPAASATAQHWVRSLDDLTALRLTGIGPAGEELLTVVRDTIATGLESGDYAFVLGGETKTTPLMADGDGRPVRALVRIDKTEPTCTSWIDVEADGGRGGAGIRAATRGICGGIATMHSALAIGLVARADVVDGANFKERPLAQVQGANRSQMSYSRLQAVHERLGATVCQSRGAGVGFDTSSRAGLTQHNSDLSSFVNDPAHDWDCTIFVRTRIRGKWVLGHFEHVQSVAAAAGVTTITTTNGLDQGNQTDAVPVAPGTNTWTSAPGGNPSLSLTGSTHADGANYIAGLPAVGHVKFLCCRKP